MYPTGLNKYFDLHSVNGLSVFFWNWVWAWMQLLMMPFSLLPADVWLGILDGYPLDDIWTILIFYEPFVWLTAYIPSMIASYFHIEMEDGWGMMYNWNFNRIFEIK